MANPRQADQMQSIIEAFAAHGQTVVAYPNPADLEEATFLHIADVVVTSHPDQVRTIVEGHGGQVVSQLTVAVPIVGVVTAMTLAGNTMAGWLSLFPPGLADPHYVHHVTTAFCCPATEPETTLTLVPVPASAPAPPQPHPVRVAVVDTGVRPDVLAPGAGHPWLANVHGDPEPAGIGHYRGHGTFVAGVVASQAPTAAVTVENIVTVGGAVEELDLITQIGQSLMKVPGQVPHVLSISAGTKTVNGQPSAILKAFFDGIQPLSQVMVVVAAAGNDGDTEMFYPAAFGWVTSVGAVDVNGNRAPYSNYGWPDVYARGSDVVNAYPNGPYHYEEYPDKGKPDACFTNGMASWSGTSFATPYVAGKIAQRIAQTGKPPQLALADVLAGGVTRPFGTVIP